MNGAVTHKWLVGVMVSLVLSMGWYVLNTRDASSANQQATISELQNRLNDVAIETATANARYTEIIRRLERIERNQDSLPVVQPTRRGVRPTEAP